MKTLKLLFVAEHAGILEIPIGGPVREISANSQSWGQRVFSTGDFWFLMKIFGAEKGQVTI